MSLTCRNVCQQSVQRSTEDALRGIHVLFILIVFMTLQVTYFNVKQDQQALSPWLGPPPHR
jgi:hypothetical protein